MDAEIEVEVDSQKECTYRFDHRDIAGIKVAGRKVCPACLEIQEGTNNG